MGDDVDDEFFYRHRQAESGLEQGRGDINIYLSSAGTGLDYRL